MDSLNIKPDLEELDMFIKPKKEEEKEEIEEENEEIEEEKEEPKQEDTSPTISNEKEYGLEDFVLHYLTSIQTNYSKVNYELFKKQYFDYCNHHNIKKQNATIIGRYLKGIGLERKRGSCDGNGKRPWLMEINKQIVLKKIKQIQAIRDPVEEEPTIITKYKYIKKEDEYAKFQRHMKAYEESKRKEEQKEKDLEAKYFKKFQKLQELEKLKEAKTKPQEPKKAPAPKTVPVVKKQEPPKPVVEPEIDYSYLFSSKR